VLHNIVDLNVSLDRPVMSGKVVNIWLKLFDPDFVSDEWDPGHDQGHDDFVPNDNRLGTPGASIAAMVTISGNDVFPDNTWKITPLTIQARQPTNNFRVATFNPRLNPANIALADDGTTVFRTDRPGDPVPQSRLLTVWRHVYVERDSMTSPDLQQSPAPSHIPAGTVASVSGPENRTIELSGVALEADQYQGGTITLLNSIGGVIGTFLIATNTETEITLDGAGPTTTPANFRDLYDDDASHAVDALAMRPVLDGLGERLEPACIVVDLSRTDLAVDPTVNVNNYDLAFKLNVNTNANEEATFYESKQSKDTSTNDFWIAYIVGAFQPGAGAITLVARKCGDYRRSGLQFGAG
jgi:hypothetical protein